MVSVWTPPLQDTTVVEKRLGSNAPDPVLTVVAFGSQFGCCPDAD